MSCLSHELSLARDQHARTSLHWYEREAENGYSYCMESLWSPMAVGALTQLAVSWAETCGRYCDRVCLVPGAGLGVGVAQTSV